jgi:hypothetical protein
MDGDQAQEPAVSTAEPDRFSSLMVAQPTCTQGLPPHQAGRRAREGRPDR